MTSHHEYRGYVFTITYQAQDPAYTVDFPDFAEIISSGSSLAEAFANACEALALHLESMQKLNMRLPKPKHRLRPYCQRRSPSRDSLPAAHIADT
jgi:predicted RNase H-like HicB family nuclease